MEQRSDINSGSVMGRVVLTAALVVTLGILASLGIMLLSGGAKSELASDTDKLIQIGKACMMYRQDNGGEYPPDFSALVHLVRGANVFASHHDSQNVGKMSDVMAWTSFKYVEGLASSTPPESVVAYLPPRDYSESRYGIVLFADGSARHMGEGEFASFLSKQTPKPKTEPRNAEDQKK